MVSIPGTYTDGRIVLDSPVDWPDGVKVVVQGPRPAEKEGFLTEDEWPTDAEGIAQLLARMAAAEPLLQTPEEEAAFRAWRREQHHATIGESVKRIEGLFP